MKTYKYISKILGIAVLAMVLSCSDATDVVQPDELNEAAAVRNLADVQTLLNGVYDAYGPDFGGNGTGDAVYFNAIFTDNVKAGIASNGQGAQAYSYIVDISGNSISEFMWPNRYLVIFRANIALDIMDRMTFSTGEMTEANHIKAQLLALRALAHFDLFQYFTTDYQDPNALAVINVDYVPEITDKPDRNTVAETLAFIKSDLNAADGLIDPANATASSPIWISEDLIKALKVKIALLEGDYSAGIMAMANELLADYPLADQSQYFSMFNDADNTEVIFKLKRTSFDSSVVLLFYFNQVLASDAYLEMSNDLYNILASNTSDIRFFVNVDAQSTFVGLNDPTNNLLIGKYPGTADQATNDIKAMRSSEIQLIKAEMQARNNDLTGAATTMQQLRTARFGTTPTAPVYGNLNDALLDILNERRIELAFEGHRFLDLKRLGGELGLGVDRLPVDCASFDAPCNLPANDFRFTLGIPQSELDGNGNITQNPNY